MNNNKQNQSKSIIKQLRKNMKNANSTLIVLSSILLINFLIYIALRNHMNFLMIFFKLQKLQRILFNLISLLNNDSDFDHFNLQASL